MRSRTCSAARWLRLCRSSSVTSAAGSFSANGPLGISAGARISAPSPRSSRSQSAHEMPAAANASCSARYSPVRTAIWSTLFRR